MLSNKYKEFNKEVYQNFFADNLNSNNHVAVIFADIVKIKGFTHFTDACRFLGNYSWESLNCRTREGYPAYLGLIAIQILALAERQETEQHTKIAYNPVLGKLLGIEDNLPRLYSKYQGAQEEIFEAFKKWCEGNGLGIQYFGSPDYRCNVRYPLSFPILHQENRRDLERDFVKIGLSANGNCDFELLRNKFLRHWPQLNTLRTFNILTSSDNDAVYAEALWTQIYLFYKNWDGTYIDEGKKKIKPIAKDTIKYYIEWNGKEDISFYPEQAQFIALLEKYKSEGCFWVKSPYNCEWHFIRFQDIDVVNDPPECNFYLYVFKDSTEISKKLSLSELEYKDDVPRPLPKCPGFSLYILNAQEIKDYLKDYLCDSKIYLRRGIKISPWSRQWLKGAGPVIELPNGSNIEKVTLIHCCMQQERTVESFDILEHKLVDLPVGYYKLRYSTGADDIIDFWICNVEDHRSQFFCNGGWKFDDKKQLLITGEDDSAHICGLDFSKIPEGLLCDTQQKSGNPCRMWMDLAATGKSPEYSNENLIHKSLRRAKNGLRFGES